MLDRYYEARGWGRTDTRQERNWETLGLKEIADELAGSGNSMIRPIKDPSPPVSATSD
jgi:hypothetical protein